MTIPSLTGVLSSATVFGVIAHAVQSYPTPQNKYGAWLLGAIQYAVGQRERAMNTLVGSDTATAAIQRGHQ
jgi:hypothetical protein